MLGHHRFAPNSVPNQKSKSWTTLPKHHAAPCADPGIFVSGGPGHLTKKALTTLFSISKKSIIFQGSRGGPTFLGGGVQLLIPYRNPYNVIFQGVRTPVPPPPSGSSLPARRDFYFKVSQWDHSSDSGLLLNCLFPIETHITCDIPGGPDPCPPLWILTTSPKRFFILKSANGFTEVTRGFYSLCKFGYAVALITLNLCDLILLLKVKFGQESPVEP